MSRLTPAALAIAALLLVPASSHAGGWATVGLSSMPDDARPGEEWVVDLTVLQHGMTPLEGVTPVVTIAPEEAAGAQRRTFEGEPTKEPGVYRARVELPEAGTWSISVHDGFGGVHEFGTVRMGEDGASAALPAVRAERGSSEPGSGVGLGTASILAALAGLVAAGALALGGRRGGPSPASG